MKLTKEIIDDLLPLYAANECSAGTRRLVEEYLREHPQEAEEMKRIMLTPIPRTMPSSADLDETQALREARRRLNRQKWLMGLAIFFSLAPGTFIYDNGRLWWFLRDSPRSALVYVALAILFWILYVIERRHPRSV